MLVTIYYDINEKNIGIFVDYEHIITKVFITRQNLNCFTTRAMNIQ